jgi:chitodextrinase
MASLSMNSTTAWADIVEEEDKAAAAAGAATPPQKEKGWTEVNAPTKIKKTKSRRKDSATAEAVKTLDFGGEKKPYNNPINKFSALADSDSE